ncbi:YbbR-like domain-containing protein [Desulforamulus aeronauticus]|uniref:YbbR domain-containing protein n=1 Tax=Desulforamulus aeronauticus DSM 10349 TaxID=1121421 RepID=A0A1M6QGB8_9FIRM|nr:CdaR family protein [Desulforamulus aeronauticus]SHK19228.1 YbbR domain-containing protein [Desulforamulus aeronauticus DSM 10349]
MIRLKWSNNSMMLLSVLLAVLLWVYVTNVQNPIKEQDFRVAVDTRGELPQGITMSGLPQTVSVRVQGKNAQLSGVRPADFQAVVDLSNVEEGTNSLPIQVTTPTGLQIVHMNPARADIVADRLLQKQFPVKIVLRGEPVKGYSAAEPVIQPSAVMVRGPARLLKDIKNVEATVDVSEASQNIEQTLTVSLPQGVSSVPDRVKVLVPVTRTMPSRTLQVVPRYIGNPADQYQIVRIIPQPANVLVYAPVEVLKELENISTEPIRIDGIAENAVKDVRLLLPAGVAEIIPGKVEVTIQVKAKQPTQGPEPTPTPPPVDTVPPEKPQTQSNQSR